MKVMLVIGALSFGGAERVMANLANYFSKNNEVILCTMFERESPYEIEEKVNLIQGVAEDGKIRAIKKIREIAKNNNPDIVLSFLTQINILTILSLIGTKIPVIVSERNDPAFEPAEFYRKILRFLFFPFAKGYVFQTKDAQNYFSKFIQKKSIVIPNPVFIENDFSFDESQRKIDEFVAVGRLTIQKNYKMMINAFSNVVLKYPNYKLKIYGSGELESALKEYISLKSMQNNIILMGTTDRLHEDIYKSFGFIMTSNHEGMPNALLEAMALGLCCISTDCPCGGPKEIIKNGENGILVHMNDENELTDAIYYLIQNKEKSKHLSKKAKKVREEFSLDVIGSKWEKYLRKCVKLYNEQ